MSDSHIGPSGMPRLRDALARAEAVIDRATAARAKTMPAALVADLDQTVWSHHTAIAHATLWWVSKEMASLAQAAADGLEPTDLVAPAPVGLMMWDGGITDDQGIPVHVVAWRPQGATMAFTLYTRAHSTGPYKAVGLLPVGDAVGRDAGDSMVARVICSTWLMMMQPRLAEQRILNQSSRAHQRGQPGRSRQVTIVQLRRVERPRQAGEPSDRNHDHRWYVRGHWRNQACGPGHLERRPVWVTPHVKGPDGTPLVTDRVHVWSR